MVLIIPHLPKHITTAIITTCIASHSFNEGLGVGLKHMIDSGPALLVMRMGQGGGDSVFAIHRITWHGIGRTMAVALWVLVVGLLPYSAMLGLSQVQRSASGVWICGVEMMAMRIENGREAWLV